VRCVANAQVQSCSKEVFDSADSELKNTVYQLSLDDGSQIAVDQIVVATGLKTEKHLAQLAGLDLDNGIVVHAATLQSSQPHIYALGDCISLAGEACRFVAPIFQQAKVIASQVCEVDKLHYKHAQPVIRLGDINIRNDQSEPLTRK